MGNILGQAFCLDIRKKTSKLKEITENSSSNPRKSALLKKIWTLLFKNQKIRMQNIRKSIKTQEKTQNLRQNLTESAFLGFQGDGKPSKQKACTRFYTSQYIGSRI